MSVQCSSNISDRVVFIRTYGNTHLIVNPGLSICQPCMGRDNPGLSNPNLNPNPNPNPNPKIYPNPNPKICQPWVVTTLG